MPADAALRALESLRLALSEIPWTHTYGPDTTMLDHVRHMTLEEIQAVLERQVISHGSITPISSMMPIKSNQHPSVSHLSRE